MQRRRFARRSGERQRQCTDAFGYGKARNAEQRRGAVAFGDEKQWNRIDQRCEAKERNREAVHRRGEDLTSNGEEWSRIVENGWQCNGEAWSRRDKQWNGEWQRRSEARRGVAMVKQCGETLGDGMAKEQKSRDMRGNSSGQMRLEALRRGRAWA